jgi:hypothetical protein
MGKSCFDRFAVVRAIKFTAPTKLPKTPVVSVNISIEKGY